MEYFSTRNSNYVIDSADAVIQGITPDGGLFVPQKIPSINWESLIKLDSLQMQTKILSAYLPEIPNMESLVFNAYNNKFDDKQLTPTVRAANFHVLELFHGPTYAFKDVALCMLPQLLTAAVSKKGQNKEIRILTATSGDTGKAALSGFKDVNGVSICVFYPYNGVSHIQKKQMITQEGTNVHVAGVKGNFDDIQSKVKEIFIKNKNTNLKYLLTSANSINIGRLTPQIMYYFKAYKDLVEDGTITIGEKVNFSVPTGNFGDILAGYLALKMGLPINKLICASNENKVLTDFINTGVYNKIRPFIKTPSPSMDILVSSNLERLLYFLCENTKTVVELMENLNSCGQYKVSDSMLKQIKDVFWAGYCDNQQSFTTIKNVYNHNKYLIDPHTSCGWFAAEKYQNFTNDKTPMVVLSTASPYKFPEAVLIALGHEASTDGFEQMDQLNNITGTKIPDNLLKLKTLPDLHQQILNVEDMDDFSLN